MPVTAIDLNALIDRELMEVSDALTVQHIRGLLIEPDRVLLRWDYGEPDEQYRGWMVLRDEQQRAAIAYCEHGFGPRSPWGLVGFGDTPVDRHIGMDCGWFATFMEAFFESFSSVSLPIWRVSRVEPDGKRTVLSDAGGWDATWKRIDELRASDPAGRYECDHVVRFGA